MRSLAFLLPSLLAAGAAIAGDVGKPTPYTDKSWSNVLQMPVNEIVRCSPADLRPGDSLSIRLRGTDANGEVRIQELDGIDAYDVVFQPRARHRYDITRLPPHSHRREIVLDLGRLRALPVQGRETPGRVFRRSGLYVVFYGYAFRGGDEGVIEGICVVRYHARR